MRRLAVALALAAVTGVAQAKNIERRPPAPPPAPAPLPTPPAAIEYPCFELKDGTRVVGTFAQTAFQVETSYGPLTVPVSDLLKVRFGTRSDPQLGDRIDALLKQLGDPDFNAREKASAELGRIGLPARKALERAAKSGDAEVQERAGRLLEVLDDADEPPPPEDDEVLTTHFLVRGVLQCPVFEVTTKYGTLKIEKRHVQRLLIQSFSRTVSVPVPGNHGVEGFVDTKLVLKRGEPLRIQAGGMITLANWGQQSGPDGNPNCGQQVPGIIAGTLVGRIGQNGPIFKVGASFDGVSERDGVLFLAVGLPSNYAQQNTGEFKVQVTAGE